MSFSKRRCFTIGLVVMLVLSMVMLSSCGKPKTLKEYAEKNDQIKEAFDNLAKDKKWTTVELKGNTLTLTKKYDVEVTDQLLEVSKSSLEENMKNDGSKLVPWIKDVEKATEIEGVSVKVIYVDKNDKEMLSQTFKDK